MKTDSITMLSMMPHVHRLMSRLESFREISKYWVSFHDMYQRLVSLYQVYDNVTVALPQPTLMG